MLVISACHNKVEKAVRHSGSTTVATARDTVVVCDGDTIYHAPTRYFNFDNIDNIEVFFDSIAAKHPLQLWSPEDSYLNEAMRQCIAHIEAFRKGKRRFFPDKLVSECINGAGFNAAIVNNHGPEYTDLVYSEWFMMCAAFYAPDITCLVETQTPDHKAGILNFGKGYNYNPWWGYLFIKREKGYETVALGDFVSARSIFQLEDRQHRKYYLCSDNLSALEFNQWLFWAKDSNHIVKVAECHKAPATDDEYHTQFYFDRNRLIWKYATTDPETDKLIATSEEPAMALLLDGLHSRFQ